MNPSQEPSMSPPVMNVVECTIPEGVRIDEYRRARPKTRRRGLRRIAVAALGLGALMVAPSAALATPDHAGKDVPDAFGLGGSPFSFPGPSANAAGSGGPAYGGATSQKEPVVLRTTHNRNRITLLGIHYSAPCDDGDTYTGTSFAPGLRVASGRFKGVDTGTVPMGGIPMDYDEHYSGKVNGRNARGSFRAVMIGREDSGKELWRCDTGRISWKAAASAYAGRTSQDEPVVVTKRGSSATISTVWEAECVEGWFGSTDTIDAELNGTSLRGASASQIDLGEYVGALDLQIAGRVTATRASGTLKAQVFIFDKKTLRQVDACHSGPVRFTAQ
jgi:hypothetical protein